MLNKEAVNGGAPAEITEPAHSPEATARGRGELYFSGRLDRRGTIRLVVGDTIIVHDGRRPEYKARVVKTGAGGSSFVALVLGELPC